MRDFVGREAEERDHVVDTREELFLLLLWVGVVVAEEADAFVVPRVAKVDVDGLRVTHVQNPVWLRGKASANL